MTAFTAHEKIAELKRELAMRHKVYPRQIREGLLQRAAAELRVAILKEIIADYERQVQPALFEPSP